MFKTCWGNFFVRGVAVLAASAVLIASHASAQLIFDGFGDGDRNNDGVINVLDADTDNSGAIDGDEITMPQDASDVGITWAATRGFTGDGKRKSYLSIKPNVIPVPAEGVDYALHAEAAGSGSSFAGYFGAPVAVGPNIGDKIIIDVDFRIWNDSPNPAPAPANGQLRWGLFQDTDSELGMSNTVGFEGASIVWGQEDGEWRDAQPGAEGDKGLWTRVPIGVLSDPEDSRNNFEYNLAGINGTSNNGRFLEGSGTNVDPGSGGDVATIGSPTSDGPGQKIGGDLTTDPDNSIPWDTTHHLRLEIERTADSVFVTSFVNGALSLGDDADSSTSGNAVNGAAPDTFDYVAFRNTNPSGGTGDWDFVIDNFTVTVPEPASCTLLIAIGLCAGLARRRR